MSELNLIERKTNNVTTYFNNQVTKIENLLLSNKVDTDVVATFKLFFFGNFVVTDISVLSTLSAVVNVVTNSIANKLEYVTSSSELTTFVNTLNENVLPVVVNSVLTKTNNKLVKSVLSTDVSNPDSLLQPIY